MPSINHYEFPPAGRYSVLLCLMRRRNYGIGEMDPKMTRARCRHLVLVQHNHAIVIRIQ